MAKQRKIILPDGSEEIVRWGDSERRYHPTHSGMAWDYYLLLTDNALNCL